MSQFHDPIVAGLERGWKVLDGAALAQDQTLEADVVIVGTGAGGGDRRDAGQGRPEGDPAGRGPLKSTRDFRMREAEVYPALIRNRQRARPRTRVSASAGPQRWRFDHGQLDFQLPHATGGYAQILANAVRSQRFHRRAIATVVRDDGASAAYSGLEYRPQCQ